MMKNNLTLYVCYTHYHILIATIKVLLNKDENSDIVLASNWGDSSLIDDNILQENLKNSQIFKHMYLFDLLEGNNINKNSYIKKIKIICRSINKLNFLDNYKNIFIFNDNATIGNVLNIKKIPYNLIEDGLDCFKNNKTIIHKKDYKRFIKRNIFKIYNHGESPLIKSIEVNDKNEVFLKHSNIIEIPRDKLFSMLDDEQKSKILNIFKINFTINPEIKYNLIITQPLYKDSLVSTKASQIQIYKDIIKNFCQENNVIIKVHPRDNIVDYSTFSNNIIVMKDKFPIEILNFIPNLIFDKIITVSSTSINALTNCNKRIKLGWEWLDKYKKNKNGQ
ncbi:glycosyltransferase family 52 [Campylobacter sp. JMF_08 NE1]|uniref:glycosyltransferase family 52 n=1 Tax=Campylobacter sp. JMF_08 NE1 TaxID=2983821 RepID=UPI0022EA0407|nr:glycosyltransferase family 52 [Campylobacter sp. JMF_08 NE1]MDA3048649.1 glycosyltransferase family 52 protein [Campylobacter sp. JMF_08 NE1]